MKKFLTILACLICIVAGAAVLFIVTNSDKPDESTSAQSEQTQLVEQTQTASQEQPGSPYKFYYQKLSDIEKAAYDKILSEIYSMPESINLPKISEAQIDTVFSALLNDNPDLFFVGRNCELITWTLKSSCSIEYIIGPDEYEKCKAELDAVCDEVIASLSNPDNEWQTELEIHDYIIDNCRYKLVDGDHVYSSAYGALVNGEAACEGYSKAAKLLFDRAGIESAVVSGKAKDENGNSGEHMWNAVKIDGEFYYLDCTWDDPVNDEGEDEKLYSYFNLNDEMIAPTHYDFSYDFGCVATAANYFVKKNRIFETYDRSDEEAVAKIIAEELEAGREEVEICFTEKETFDNAVEDLMENGRILEVLDIVSAETDFEFAKEKTKYSPDEERLVLTIIPDVV